METGVDRVQVSTRGFKQRRQPLVDGVQVRAAHQPERDPALIGHEARPQTRSVQPGDGGGGAG